MDPDTIYEEETVELNTESDAKDHNTDSEGDMHEVVVGGEEVIEQHLDEVVLYDNASAQSLRRETRRSAQVVTKKGEPFGAPKTTGVVENKLLKVQQQRTAVAAVKSPGVKLIPGQKMFPMAKPIKVTSVASSPLLAAKRKAEASPMIVKLDNVKKGRISEGPQVRPLGVPQSKVRIVRHSHMQTELSGDILEQYQLTIDEDQQKIATLEDQIRKLKYTPEMFENDDKRTEYFTGMDSFVTMITLFNNCEVYLPASSALSKFEIYMLTLLKLRLKLPLPFLGYMFSVSPKAATFFYNECLSVLQTSLREVFSDTVETVEAK